MRSLWAILAALALVPQSALADADSLFAKGLAEAKAGQLDSAKASFTEGRLLYPKDPRFWTELAGLAYLRKDTAAAKHWLRGAVRLAPTDPYTNEFLGTLYQIDGNLPATLKYWNRVGKPFLSGITFPESAGLNPAFRARLIDFSPGQMLTLARLRTTEANVTRSDVLADLRIDLLAVPATQNYTAVVQLAPLAFPLNGWLGLVLPMLRELPYQGLVFDRYDIGGNGDSFASLGRWDHDKRRIDLAWQAPVDGDPRSEYLVNVDLRDENWQLPVTSRLEVRSAAIEGNYITGLADRLQWTLGGTFSRHTFGNSGYSDVWVATVNNRFDYDLLEWPEHRLTVSTWALFNTGRTFGQSSSPLITTRGGLSTQWFPQAKGEKYHLTAQFQSGTIIGSPPVDELFQLGMERDTETDLWLRGLQSAANGRKGTGLLGRDYAIAQTTFERKFFHIPFLTVAAGPFFDAGEAWNAGHGLRNAPFTYDSGVEADLKTIGGIGLTVIYGRNLQSGRGAFYSATSR